MLKATALLCPGFIISPKTGILPCFGGVL